MSLLTVEGLRTQFMTDGGAITAVDGVDMSINSGEIVGLVGESGSGKSVTARSLMGLIQPPGRITEGQVNFNGRTIRSEDDSMAPAEMRSIRGAELAMIFQDPEAAFNPTQTVGRQIHDVLRTHQTGPVNPIVRLLGFDDTVDRRGTVVETLERVGISEAETRYDDYPHEFSGGMLQRAMIAMAIICEPQLLIADEPTTALDVTIERQIMSIVRDLVDDMGMAVLWITHDLSVVSSLCDRVLVMYAGRIVESGPTETVLSDPRHPYTQGLLESIPRHDRPGTAPRTIEGTIPDPENLPSGCRFADRCPEAHDRCREAEPPMYQYDGGEAACYLLDEKP